MMKIVLINPSQDFEKIYGGLSEAAGILPPLGLCYLAGFLKSSGYHQVKIIDAQALRISNKQAAQKALKWKPQIIGITATTDMTFLASEIADFIKSKSKSIKVIVGGPHVSAVPERTLRMFPSFDIAVIGEGEKTLQELVAAIRSRQSLKKIKGIVYRSRKKIVLNQPREFIQDLDALPLPAWNLLPTLNKFYRPTAVNYKSLPAASLVTSRGCPGQCAFCDTRVFGCRYRIHSTKYVLKSIRHLKRKYQINDIYFYDDQFTIFKKRLLEICEGIRAEKIKLDWSCQARIGAVDYETMKKMKEAGCWKISFGIESGSPKILKLMNKNISLKQAQKDIAAAKKAGLEVLGYFILGFFGETKKTLSMTKRFIMESDLDHVMLSYFLPFPGSPAYPHLKKYGQFHEDWRNLNAFDSDTPQFIPRNLKAKDLVEAQKDIYRSFYFRPRIIAQNALKILKNPAEGLRLGQTALSFGRFLYR